MNAVVQRCRRVALSVAAGLVLGLAGGAPAQDRPTDYQVKAAFLEKFGKFIEWPNNAFATPGSPLVIGVFGENPFHGALENLAARDTINGHPVEVRELKALPDLKGCHIVFVASTAKAEQRDVLDAIRRSPILTVGDTDDFCDNGGMVQFIVQNDQVHFQIRNEAARAAGLKISSKLLILAKRAGQ